MNIAITGSTGLIGSAATEYLRGLGHTVTRIGRPETQVSSGEKTIPWDIDTGDVYIPDFAGQEAVIHLAGANVAGQKWTRSYKRKILESRVNGTRLLCQTLAQFKLPPKVICSASAVGVYGMQDASRVLDESAEPANDFLANVCRQWEEATQPAVDVGIRVVHMRFGVVLSAQGGALAKMLPPFKLGLGGPIGSGNQIMSWIALEEIPRVIEYLITHDGLSGPVNVVAPGAVSNKEFARVLGEVLKRPAVLPLPSVAVKILLGEMGRTLLLGGQNVVPKKLMFSGYAFKYPSLEETLRVSLSNTGLQ